MTSQSPLLTLPGAVEAPGPDAGVAWHYGDPIGEQRAALRGPVLVDLSHRGLVTVTGPDRLTWLHTLASQQLADLSDGGATWGLVLNPQGQLEHQFELSELDGTAWLSTEPGRAAALAAYLSSMVFWSKVEVASPDDWAQLRLLGPDAGQVLVLAGLADAEPAPGRVVPLIGGGRATRNPELDLWVPRDRLTEVASAALAAGARPVGTWAADALRIAAGLPRFGLDTDDRTIPNELPWLHTAVHLNKGCYRGQETVARVANLGRPPRRLVRLHLDGSAERLPELGEPVTAGGRTVGRVGTSAHHHEDGPIALALLKRSVPAGTPLLADGVDASAEPDDVADAESGPPVSAIDHRAFAEFRRPR